MASWFTRGGSEQDEPAESATETVLEPTPVQGELIVEDAEVQDSPSSSLMLLEQAHRAIAEARSLNELKDIRDKAEAARKYAQAAGMGLEIQNYAAEVKLRAERRAGKLLAKLNLHGGDRSEATSSSRLTLNDIGVSKDQSARWQLTAVVPEKTFEQYVDSTRGEGGEVTTAGLVRIAKEIKAKESAKKQQDYSDAEADNCLVIQSAAEVASQPKFACVYVDAPWAVLGNVGALEALGQIPVELAVEDNAHLHMWAKNENLFAAKEAMQNWGFEFRGCLICLDPEGNPGEYWMEAHEFLLLGVRGELPLMERRLNSWMRAPRESDGSPSERIRKIVERVSPGPFLQVFGNKKASGWTIYSPETESSVAEQGGSSE